MVQKRHEPGGTERPFRCLDIGTAERCYQHFRDLITSICPTERSKPFYGDLKQTKAEPGTARYSQVQPGTGDIRGATFISAAVC